MRNEVLNKIRLRGKTIRPPNRKGSPLTFLFLLRAIIRRSFCSVGWAIIRRSHTVRAIMRRSLNGVRGRRRLLFLFLSFFLVLGHCLHALRKNSYMGGNHFGTEVNAVPPQLCSINSRCQLPAPQGLVIFAMLKWMPLQATAMSLRKLAPSATQSSIQPS